MENVTIVCAYVSDRMAAGLACERRLAEEMAERFSVAEETANNLVDALLAVSDAVRAPAPTEQGEGIHRRAADLAARLLCEEFLDEEIEREMARDFLNADLAVLAHAIADAEGWYGLNPKDGAVLRELETELGTDRKDLLEKGTLADH